MATYRSKKAKRVTAKKAGKARNFDFEKVPFVPAPELLAKQNSMLSEEEIAAVAMTLYLTTQKQAPSPDNWTAAAKFESISQRL